MRCCTPGSTFDAITSPAGACSTHGSAASTSKKTAPVNRTARSTSESVSRLTGGGLRRGSQGGGEDDEDHVRDEERPGDREQGEEREDEPVPAAARADPSGERDERRRDAEQERRQ